MKIIITGGASGIGAAIVARCLDDGHQVVVLDIADSPHGRTLLVDLADADAAADATCGAIAEMGGVDAVVTVAGINRPGPAAGFEPDTIRKIIGVNLTASIVVAVTALPDLERSHGRIVAIGSTMSKHGAIGQVPYSAAKFGLHGFIQSLGHEYRGRIGISLVNPGPTRTSIFEGRTDEWIPNAGTMVEPSVIANAVAFALDQPAEVSVRELTITSDGAQDWP